VTVGIDDSSLQVDLRLKSVGFVSGLAARLAVFYIHQIKPISQLRFDYDTTTIRRYHDAFDYDGSDRNYDMRSIRLRHDYDEKLTCSFFACVESRRMEAGVRDTSLWDRNRIVVS